MGVKLEANGGGVKDGQPFGTAVYAAGANLAGLGASDAWHGAEGNADLGSRRPSRAPRAASRGAGRAASRGLLGDEVFHFVPFPIWGLGCLGTDLGEFDTRMGRNGTHLGRNGTPVWALAAAARRGYLPGRGAAHEGIIARAFVRCQMPCGRTLRLIIGSQPHRASKPSRSFSTPPRAFAIAQVAPRARIGSGCCIRGSPTDKDSRPTPEGCCRSGS